MENSICLMVFIFESFPKSKQWDSQENPKNETEKNPQKWDSQKNPQNDGAHQG